MNMLMLYAINTGAATAYVGVLPISLTQLTVPL